VSSSSTRFSRVTSFLVFSMGLLVLVGWQFDIEPLKTVFPRLVAMNPLTALAFEISALSLWMLVSPVPRLGRRLGEFFAAAVVSIGSLQICATFLGWNLGLDRALFRHKLEAVASQFPNRMAPNTALAFLAVGIALLLLHEGRRFFLAHALTVAAALIAFLTLVGYLWSLKGLSDVPDFIPMALNTAAGFVLLCSGMFQARPEEGIAAVVMSGSAGGVLARRLLPAAILIPIALGWLRLLGEKRSLYSPEFGVSLMVVACDAFLVVLIWGTARFLNRADIERQRAEEALRKSERALAEAEKRRKREASEAALQQNEERYHALVENSSDAIALLGRDGEILYGSSATTRVLGYTLEDFVGRNALDMVHPEDSALVASRMAEVIQSPGSPVEFAARMRHCDGSWRFLEGIFTNLLHVASVGGIVSNYRDATDKRLLEEQFRQAQKMEAVGQLAGGVAHDFNNLLTVILGYADLLATEAGRESSLAEPIHEIRKAGERAASLTRQLLAFSRKQLLEPIVLGVNELVGKLEKMLRRLIGEDVELVTRLDPSVSNVRADPGQLEQVIVNLVVNARDAMPRGGRLTIETADADLDEAYAQRHAAVRPGHYAMVAVSDTGIGMDAATQARIFEPFFTTKEKGKGTGLGLSTAYGIVKQSGGYIWVYSEPGHGTTFKVYLPSVMESSAVREARARAADAGKGSETILLVEDEQSVRTLSRRILEVRGYRVLEAARGAEALELVRATADPIHLVLTDLVMPDMSGSELASRVVALRPAVRVLYMSGYTDDGVIHNGLLEQGGAFLQKPFTPEVLARKVRKTLGGGKPQD
jgi:two-component system cell cycle sensor histidine kinase/response regulator CckA